MTHLLEEVIRCISLLLLKLLFEGKHSPVVGPC